MSFADKAILAKSRAMYGHHLTESDYDQLLEKKSVKEIVAYLKTTEAYKDCFEGLREDDMHRGNVEALLNEEAFKRVSRLIRYADKKEQSFYRLGIRRSEIDIILHVIRSIMHDRLDEFHLNFPTYLAKCSTFPIQKLLYVKTYQEVIDVVEKTRYYPILKKYLSQDKIDLNTLELELERAFYDKYIDEINSLYKGKVRKELITMIETMIEVENITKIYRLKKYFKATPEEIENVLLLDHTRMSKKMIFDLINSPTEQDVLKRLENSPYQFYVDENEYVYIEYYTDRMRYNLAKRHMRFTTQSPIVYMAYIFVYKMERENLKHIIEGLRYKEEPEQIRQLLIY